MVVFTCPKVVTVFGRVGRTGVCSWVAGVKDPGGIGEFEELDIGVLYIVWAAAGVAYLLVQHTHSFEWPKKLESLTKGCFCHRLGDNDV